MHDHRPRVTVWASLIRLKRLFQGQFESSIEKLQKVYNFAPGPVLLFGFLLWEEGPLVGIHVLTVDRWNDVNNSGSRAITLLSKGYEITQVIEVRPKGQSSLDIITTNSCWKDIKAIKVHNYKNLSIASVILNRSKFELPTSAWKLNKNLGY